MGKSKSQRRREAKLYARRNRENPDRIIKAGPSNQPLPLSNPPKSLANPKKKKKNRRPKSDRVIPKAGYAAYMKSPRWARRRRKFLAMFGRKCSHCQQLKKQIHVHHKTYERLGRELDEDLQVLCVDCHTDLHIAEVFGVTHETLDAFLLSRPLD